MHVILYPTQRIWSLHLRVVRLKVVINTGLVHERTLDSQSMILTDAKFCAVKFVAKLVILLSVENQICPCPYNDVMNVVQLLHSLES